MENKLQVTRHKWMRGTYTATYKDVLATIAMGRTWVSIYAVFSRNMGHGEAQEFVVELKKRYPKRKVCSSYPLNDVWQHICDKYELDYPKDDEWLKE